MATLAHAISETQKYHIDAVRDERNRAWEQNRIAWERISELEQELDTVSAVRDDAFEQIVELGDKIVKLEEENARLRLELDANRMLVNTALQNFSRQRTWMASM